MKVQDTLNFISKLTPMKVWNASKVMTSYYLAKNTGRNIQWGLPFNLSVEPTTTCNLGCPECPSGIRSFTRPTGDLDTAFYDKLLDEMGSKLIYLYFYFQGEPYLHPDFLGLVRSANEKGVYSVTSTNAHFLTARKAKETVESGLDRIIVSLDGTTQDVYEQYRVNGSLEKVKKGIRNLVDAKKDSGSTTPHVILQFLVVKPNEHQIEDVKQLSKELGVDQLVLKTAQLYDYENGNELMPSIEKYSRYKLNGDGKYHIKNDMKNSCWKLWHSSVVTWDGRVVPCCFDKDAQHQLGDLNYKTFKEIWSSDLYDSFRKRILKGRSEIDICTNCSEGTKVWS